LKRRLLLAAPIAAVAGCTLLRRRRKPPTPPPEAHYVVGRPYQADGVWRYPRESFDLDETGLASVIGDHGPLCTDGARYDPTALVAAHPTLQLPCVARITNLETGLQVVLRIDDRGPASPARAVALSPRAAELLGPGSDTDAAGAPVLQVRLQVLEVPSRALADALPGGQAVPLPISAAPAGSVQAEALAPPPGAAGQAGAQPQGTLDSAPRQSAVQVPDRMPEAVTQGPPQAGDLFIDAGGFSRPQYARLLASRIPGLGAVVDTDYAAPRDRAYRVRIGPLASVRVADATLDRALQAGVVDARIVVEP
jgi:rare lipoprotein A